MSDERPTPPPSDRRSFLKRLTGEAVHAAGTIAGTTGIVVRSANAASEAAASELGIAPDPATAPRTSTATAAPTAAPTPPSSPPAVAPRPAAAAVPLRPLTPREEELLAATTAAVAANSADGTPHLTRAPFHWDGEVARMLGQLFGQRIVNVERDGRIAVLVEDGRGWLTLIGEASVVAGAAAAAEAAPLLARDHPALSAAAAWAELTSTGDQAVIVIRPTRIVSQAG